ncbi:MAG: ammonia-forming cytochrome c nitrite reductase subunit c552 [Longimicrobiales bacterium]
MTTDRKGRAGLWALVTVVFLLAGVGIGMLLTNIQQRKDEGMMSPSLVIEIPEDELDPAVWGQNFPREYGRFQMMEQDYGRTLFGGSTPYSKIEEKPFLKQAWAGYSFAVDYNEERSHYYALIDQKETKRTTEFDQPGACANCHAAEAPQLIEELGWERFNSMPYDSLRDRMHTGGTCADCHDPKTLDLRITRPAFIHAMEKRGVDLSRATRQEMRTYVCGQCHVEYYFAGENKLLTFPWEKGTSIDSIEAFYDSYAFNDWTHAETGGGMIKMQHPEFETFTSSVHYASGVACADCHMPYTREGGVKISDHWIRSPLTNVNNACQTCHKIPEADLVDRVENIQKKTKEMITLVELAISDAIDAIVAAREAGASDPALAEARRLHRAAQMRWDFVDAENSMGFHSPQETARVLTHAVDLARQAQMAAMEAMPDR